MFEIEYKGGNCVVFTTKAAKLVVDPKLSLIGMKDYNTKDALVLGTESRFLSNSSDERLTIEGPGEYEVGEFSIRGIAAVRHIDTGDVPRGTTMYRIDIGEVRVALLGNIDANLDEDQLEAIGIVDILVIPVGGGGYTLDSMNAAKLARQIDPKVVIPVHYGESGVAYEVPQDPLQLFTDELGVAVETVDKYKVKNATVLPAAMTVVAVNRA